MKCPKCSYLAFETGDRCKNCGYDFSLMADPSELEIDLDLALRSSDDALPVSWQWDDQFDGALTAAPAFTNISNPVPLAPDPPTARAERTDRKLPLFAPAFGVAGDEPLIKLPATPRPPLAVRRTPERARLRTVPKPSRPIVSAPALEFVDVPRAAPIVESAADVRARTAARLAPPVPHAAHAEVSGPGARLAAAAVDHLLLSAIDLAVVYFTLRMAGLAMTDWAALPPIPLVAFLLLVKLSYFCAFTAVGGQTIGKMAARIRVVTTEDAAIDGARAVTRTLAALVSAAPLCLGYLPALVGSERLALHDRVARTRVVALPVI
ncbi:MAG: hypothetical protein HW394_313 [Acidobacteria bacterium]|nr:hypothetical protein [Acidobacteriota bacterium]